MNRKAGRFGSFTNTCVGSLVFTFQFVGCGKDHSQSLVDKMLAPPSRQLAKTDLDSPPQAPKSMVEQTSYSERVPEPVWFESFAKAAAEAESNDKLILADFTGSDWCHWCVKLKQDVFDTPEFKSWAKDNVVLLELDFPRKSTVSLAIREQNEMLKSRYNVSSFPTVLILDAAGNVRAKMGYERGKSPSEWVQLAESRLQQNAMQARSMATGEKSLLR